MPFGAQIDGDTTRFRLWAPAAHSVDIELGPAAGGRRIRLQRDDDGWYEARLDGVGASVQYRYLIDDMLRVPDPASRYNPQGVHGASEVIDPLAFDWRDADWHGRRWEEAVIYELHVGAFSPAGDFDGVRRRLDYLADLGVTAIELMPVAAFPGRRGWGYDGVLPFAPAAAYGRPEELKTLVQEAHARGLMALLDVVYNHFGPDGNYLHTYAPDFFNPHHQTPWGAAINFDAPGSEVVRAFFIHNALYWLQEFHLDGLRLDAIHAICDDSRPDIVEALCAAVQAGPGCERKVHLILENDRNQARYLARDTGGRATCASAQWNDDFHHAIHVLTTGERDGYYADFATAPAAQLGRCLSEGFAFQGDPSPFRKGAVRGEPSRHLPPAAFVDALQTHDQIGNRAFGERLCQLATAPALEAATAVLLLAPPPPMLFMGEEFAAAQPFLFFCDFGPNLAQAVIDGRRLEFARFDRFADPATRVRIPDPNAEVTFTASVLDWSALERAPHDRWLALYRRLPIDPAEYPRIAGHHLERLAASLGADHERLLELQSLLTAFGHLPPRHTTDRRQVAERDRDKEVHKRHLAALCEALPAIRQHIEQCVAEFNGRPDDPASFDLLHGLIQAQAWRAAYWRVASDDINYRRFFDINDLAALRMEDPAVFDSTHRLVLDLIAGNKLHGLRIDHPDGLNDPRAYFERLQNAVRSRAGTATAPAAGQPPGALALYLVVEKILAEHERLPDDWPIHGATGYRFANLVNALFVDPAAQRHMSHIYVDFVRQHDDFDTLVYECKKLIMHSALASELNVLANRLAHIAAASRSTCDYTLNGLRQALTEVIACFPVYRTYLSTGQASDDDRRHIDWAVTFARRRSQVADVGIYDFVRDVLTTDISAGKGPSYRDQVRAFAMKFQQFSAPVMAKGLEDTAFYRYQRLISLNDVGADPRRFGISVTAYHTASRVRAKSWPHELLATSTHDSKRAEDVRARINVLSELPAAWKLTVRRWRRLNRSKKRPVNDLPAPSANDEYLLYQTLVGSFALAVPDTDALADYRQRIEAYMQKAVREAKLHSSWINVNADYEAALSGFIQTLLTPAETNLFLAELAAAAKRLVPGGLRNSLAQTLLKLTSPGVPDIYQGSELWQFHLVDPDNRRPVDYALRRARLAEVKALLTGAPDTWAGRLQPLVDNMPDGRIKLYLTWRALQLRGRWPELFRDGDYLPLPASGTCAEHVCAYSRRHEGHAVVTIVPRLLTKLAGGRDEPAAALDWCDTHIILPQGATTWYDVLTGGQYLCSGDGSLNIGALLADFPVALLVNDKDVLTP